MMGTGYGAGQGDGVLRMGQAQPLYEEGLNSKLWVGILDANPIF